jgi:parallel beta-helix repeat protein
VFMNRSNDNVLRGNALSSNRWHGILLMFSQDNQIRNNRLTKNRNGITLFAGRNNIIRYNNIYRNKGFGVEAKDNNNDSVDASYNYWGDESGPYHSANNPLGEGDIVSTHVVFRPWFEEYVEKEYVPDSNKGEEHFATTGFSVLLFTVFVLLLALVVVARMPDHYFQSDSERSMPRRLEEQTSLSSQGTFSCPHCGGKFEIETKKRPLKFRCYFCGKEVEISNP